MSSLNGRWLVLSIAALGCGGSQAVAPAASTPNEVREHSASGPVNPVSKQGSGTVTAKLGAGGGSLELTEGPRVTIPRGAVEGGQTFVLKVAAKTTAFSNKENERPLGPTFSFAPPLEAPDGETIEVSFPLGTLPSGWGDPSIAFEYEEAANVSLGEDSTRTKWQYEHAVLANGRLTAKLPKVAGLRLQFVLSNLEAQ
ncbi:MAG: hypothetical protein RL701_4229 [Pseudomonadota bacterium]|jgi:hypothetical protein